RPGSSFLSGLPPAPGTPMHTFAGEWAGDPGGYGLKLSTVADLAQLIMLHHGDSPNDAIVTQLSAFARDPSLPGGLTSAVTRETAYGAGYHHFGMHQGMPEQQRPDPLLQRVVEIIREVLGTAT